jgi:hypothetical protein
MSGFVAISVPKDTALPMVQGAERQMPFAIARALTWVAEDVKFMLAKEFNDHFTVRTPWIGSPQRWEVTPARKEDHPHQVARVDLDHRAPFLADFQFGKVRMPGDRAYDRVSSMLNQIYMPTPTLRPTLTGRIPLALTPKAIGISLRMDASGSSYRAGRGKHSRKTAKAAVKRYFRMRPGTVTGPAAGIWERFGSGVGLGHSGHDKLRFLWKALPSVTIQPRLHTFEWAQAEVLKQWPDKMQRSFALAMATAR